MNLTYEGFKEAVENYVRASDAIRQLEAELENQPPSPLPPTHVAEWSVYQDYLDKLNKHSEYINKLNEDMSKARITRIDEGGRLEELLPDNVWFQFDDYAVRINAVQLNGILRQLIITPADPYFFFDLPSDPKEVYEQFAVQK